MSADNGIYVLRTRDNLRKVLHIQGIDLYWSWINGGEETSKIQPQRLFQYFWNCQGTKNSKKANEIAHILYRKEKRNYGYIEYGIREIKVPYTWDELRRKAIDNLKIEMNFLKNHPSEWHDCQLKRLQEIVM